MNKKLLFVTSAILIITAVFIALSAGKTGFFARNKTGGSPASLLLSAKDLELKGNSIEAKAVYQKLINDFPGSGDVMNWQKKIESINIKLLFSPAITPKSVSYVIKSGDTLAKIAKEYNTTVELIKKSNGLRDDRIVPGRKIKVWNAPFSILVDKSQNTLVLKSEEEIFKTYIVSTGANNSTPVGTFKIIEKIPNPTWFKAGVVVPPESPENVLGTRWLGFDLPGYGIHGTTDPKNLGKQVTQGCVRLSNPEVEELYTIVAKGTEVTIAD